MNKHLTLPGVVILCFTLVAFILTGCRPSYETQLPKFAAVAKKAINPTNLQNWAIEVLKTNGNVADKDLIPLNIRNLTFQGTPFSFASRNANSVQFVWTCFIGGAWGIEVGPQPFKPYNPTGIYYIEWQPGVYFWHDK